MRRHRHHVAASLALALVLGVSPAAAQAHRGGAREAGFIQWLVNEVGHLFDLVGIVRTDDGPSEVPAPKG